MQLLLKEILDLILPIMSPESYRDNDMKPEKGVILYGLPGTGKTQLVKAVQRECTLKADGKISCFSYNGAKLLNGDSIGNLDKVFARVKTLGPSVVFIDEVDTLFAERSVTALKFLELMDGVKSDGQTFFLAAKKRGHEYRQSLQRPGRFETAFELLLPTLKERIEWLQLLTRKWDVTQIKLNEAAAFKTQDLSLADLAALCRKDDLSALKKNNPCLQGHASTWVLPFNNRLFLIPSDMDNAQIKCSLLGST